MCSKIYFILTKEKVYNPNTMSGHIVYKPDRIFYNLRDNIYMHEIYLQKNDPDFYLEKNEYYCKVNMITLGNIYDLRDPKTWRYMILIGIKIHEFYKDILNWAVERGYLEIIKYFVESGIDINMDINIVGCNMLILASKKRNLQIV
ncbi:repeat protein [Moumouvirus goulette]|uniref:Repeat protein n=1 Tax=Moumouvirus goulette TaxID=1247379 RepID=M1PBK3_9VIRU|nr:repeat protein [Moumouvirus goulette]AGF85314.1 repeat protein [Moumouvirus goulette]